MNEYVTYRSLIIILLAVQLGQFLGNVYVIEMNR